MSLVSPYMHPATLISYDKVKRTAQVAIAGLTDGVADGITAMIAYPIGDDDRDTERELINGADVWVFFEQGDTTMPVITFYRRHGQGRAVVDIRRIRQKNIEVLARSNITLTAKDFINVKANKVSIEADVVDITAGTVNVNAETNFRGDINQVGDFFMTGNQTVNGGQTINGDSVSYGDQTINGSIYATIDMKAGDISVRYHYHSGVKTGDGNTGASISK